MADIDDSILQAIGDLIVGALNGGAERLPAGVPSYLLVVDPSSPHQLKWISVNELLSYILAHKGSMAVASSPSQVREFPVGVDGYVLMADSGTTVGMRWMNPDSLLYYSLDFTLPKNSFYLPGVM